MLYSKYCDRLKFPFSFLKPFNLPLISTICLNLLSIMFSNIFNGYFLSFFDFVFWQIAYASFFALRPSTFLTLSFHHQIYLLCLNLPNIWLNISSAEMYMVFFICCHELLFSEFFVPPFVVSHHLEFLPLIVYLLRYSGILARLSHSRCRVLTYFLLQHSQSLTFVGRLLSSVILVFKFWF